MDEKLLSFFGSKECEFITCYGESMEPLIKDGSICVIDRNKAFKNKSICVINTRDGLFIKQVLKRTQKSLSEIEANTNLLVQSINDMAESIKEQTAGITQINDSVAQIDQTTKDNVEIANESAIISSTVSDIANNILEDVKKKRF
ncbi:S24 family peptidase [Campylobacter jejuni]|uniref:S24 family peptidase n=1 Tax=Campylobacter jejuni TaxID=197 RepID=UPI003DA7A7E9